MAWASAASAQTDTVSAALAHWLEQPSLTFGATTINPAGLRNVYARSNYQTLWATEKGLTARGQKVLALIEAAGEQGLSPERYAVSTIHSVAAMPRSNVDTTTQITLSLDLLMSNAVLQYASDMHGGVARHQWNTGEEKPSDADETAHLIQAASTLDSATYLQSLAPASPEYSALKRALKQYQALSAAGGWPQFAEGKTIKAGMSDARLPIIRQILVANGDMAATQTLEPTLYDAAMQAGIKHFQQRHGIEADGIIGSSTQAALNVPASDRVEQIALTLERMRWMPNNLGSRYVLVNIPGYSLKAVSGSAQLTMPVIVGANSTKTPMFSKEITNVVINPSWGVPAKIAVNELLPKVRKNPSYLNNAGYTVIARDGGEIDPSVVDWNSIDKSNFSYSFRQNPGSGNALGKVKFTIPDSDNIYLHDTARPELFSRSDRNLSHGCVRLSDPEALTNFVLTGEGWDSKKIDTAYNSSASRTVAITPMPVHLVYWTSWVDDTGQIHFGRDVYGMDKPLLAAMNKPSKREDSFKLAMN
jgi:murein L,D-transpeptidase YcbB/YkuD